MSDYFHLVTEELLIKLNQIRQFITKHNQTIGILTEQVLRNFLRTYLPAKVSVEQGFMMLPSGKISRQCDILIYDSQNYAPLYRLDDIVVVATESVIAIIEVKTTITKQILHQTIDYFRDISIGTEAKTYLFIYKACEVYKLERCFLNYKHKGEYQKFDHDTFQLLPDEITGMDSTYHLKKDYVITDTDRAGYVSYFYKNEENNILCALELFFRSVYSEVTKYSFGEKKYTDSNQINNGITARPLQSYLAIDLFDT